MNTTDVAKLAAIFVGIVVGIPLCLLLFNGIGVTDFPFTRESVTFVLVGSFALYLPTALSYLYFRGKMP